MRYVISKTWTCRTWWHVAKIVQVSKNWRLDWCSQHRHLQSLGCHLRLPTHGLMWRESYAKGPNLGGKVVVFFSCLNHFIFTFHAKTDHTWWRQVFRSKPRKQRGIGCLRDDTSWQDEGLPTTPWRVAPVEGGRCIFKSHMPTDPNATSLSTGQREKDTHGGMTQKVR